MKIRQNSYGNWYASHDGRVVALESSLPALIVRVKPVVGDDLPTVRDEEVLASGGLKELIRVSWITGRPPVQVLPLP